MVLRRGLHAAGANGLDVRGSDRPQRRELDRERCRVTRAGPGRARLQRGRPRSASVRSYGCVGAPYGCVGAPYGRLTFGEQGSL
eukprot:2371990-Prymnesium_polylepis.1